MTLTEKCNAFGPQICRLAAAPATTRQIALRSGLPRSTVHQISLRPDWNGVTLEVIERFSRACGVNLLASKRAKQHLTRRSWRFLDRVKPSQRKLVNRLLNSAKAA